MYWVYSSEMGRVRAATGATFWLRPALFARAIQEFIKAANKWKSSETCETRCKWNVSKAFG